MATKESEDCDLRT